MKKIGVAGAAGKEVSRWQLLEVVRCAKSVFVTKETMTTYVTGPGGGAEAAARAAFDRVEVAESTESIAELADAIVVFWGKLDDQGARKAVEAATARGVAVMAVHWPSRSRRAKASNAVTPGEPNEPPREPSPRS